MAIHVRLLAKGLTGLGVIATALSVGIVKKDDIYHHFYPNDNRELNKKIGDLGISDCELGNGESTKTCVLDKAKIEKIKFDEKAGAGLTPESAFLSLTIEKGYENFRDPNQSKNLYFPEGLRFSFTNSSSSDVTIGDNPKQITFKSNTTYDYKIKTEKDKDDTLEKAIDLSNSTDSTDLLNKVGLTCGSNTAEECNLGTGSVNVWKGRNSYKTGVGSDPTSTQKKIKVAKDSAGYRQGIKFYIEEETTLKTNDNVPKDYPLNKETSYEIDIREIEEILGSEKQIVKKWFLVDKSTEKLNEKIKALGITGCDLVEGEISKICSLDKEKIKTIKFDGKGEDTLSPDSSSLTLTIERDHLGSEFPWGLRFTFTNSSESDVTIGSSNNTITFKAGFIYDYKMKTDGTQLEKAWKLTTLANKVGLTCDSDTETECTLKTSGINVWKNETDYITGATQADSNKKMTVTKDQKDYLEGFKFSVKEDEEDITLTAGTKKKNNDGVDKLTKTGKAYGIDVKDIGGIKTWFLVEKSTSVPT